MTLGLVEHDRGSPAVVLISLSREVVANSRMPWLLVHVYCLASPWLLILVALLFTLRLLFSMCDLVTL